ncbi:MAG TPA: hypothetical protein VGP46_11600, partial [Acidimicrobiales bacterium]|nr:hypothetical protein [Acidimicrobiales bacterium]
MTSSPNPKGASRTSFTGVSCVSSASCIAVGWTGAGKGLLVPLVEAWNGDDWKLQSVPSGSTGGTLQGVKCPSRSLC